MTFSRERPLSSSRPRSSAETVEKRFGARRGNFRSRVTAPTQGERPQPAKSAANSTDFQNGSLIMITIKQTAGSHNCAQKGHLRDSRKQLRPTSRDKRAFTADSSE